MSQIRRKPGMVEVDDRPVHAQPQRSTESARPAASQAERRAEHEREDAEPAEEHHEHVTHVVRLTAMPPSADAWKRWCALSTALATPARLVATMLGISQRVMWIATPICGAGKPCATSGTK